MNWVPPKSAKVIAHVFFLTAVVMFAATNSVAKSETTAEAGKSAVLRANRLAAAGRADEAIELLRAALVAQPGGLNFRLALANIYSANNQDEKAEQEFHEALRRHPDSESAETALGTFYLHAGSLSSAEQVLEDATRRHPRSTAVHSQLALVLAREHKYKDAQVEIRAVPPPLDRNARVRYFRLAASIYAGLDDKPAAAHAMEQAARAMPSDEELQLVTAVADAEAGEWQASIRHTTPFYARHPTASAGLLLLRAQLATQQAFESTLQSLQALNLPDDEKLALCVHSAELLAGAGKHDQAAAQFAQASAIAGGTDEILLYNLAVEQYASGQFDDAFATLNSLRSQNDSAEIEDLLGDIEERKGDSSAAIHSHERAVALAPHEEKYRLSLGAELLKYQAYEAAVSVFRQAAEIFPASARVFVGLGMAEHFMDKYEDSVEAFLRADKLDDKTGRAIGYLGATQLDSASGPIPAAINATCERAGSSTPESGSITWCAALLFRKAYLGGNESAAPDVIRRLQVAARLSPADPVANCSLGQALEWSHQLPEARHWLEICIRLRPDSTENRYRLSRVYQRLGLKQSAADQTRLIEQAGTEADARQSITQKFENDIIGVPTINSNIKE